VLHDAGYIDAPPKLARARPCAYTVRYPHERRNAMTAITIITLALSFAVLFALLALHRRAVSNARGAGIDHGKQQGFAAGLAEQQRQLYAQGYADGKAEGRELERRERELSAEKAYGRGYQAALDELDSDDFAELRDHAQPTLSA
jgi:hypothetical protein